MQTENVAKLMFSGWWKECWKFIRAKF